MASRSIYFLKNYKDRLELKFGPRISKSLIIHRATESRHIFSKRSAKIRNTIPIKTDHFDSILQMALWEKYSLLFKMLKLLLVNLHLQNIICERHTKILINLPFIKSISKDFETKRTTKILGK